LFFVIHYFLNYSLLNIDNTASINFINPVNTLVTGEVIVERNENISIQEALRQINIQMIDSSNIYDGLETLWLGSADESLSSQQVNSFFFLYIYLYLL
jgi:hypothetical protein